MGVAQLLYLLGFVALGKSGAEYDARARVLQATAGQAADLRAPNAEVARTRASRLARQAAEAQLVRGLEHLKLGGTPEERSKLAHDAELGPVDYRSDGSVRLTLVLRLGTR